MVLLYLYLKLLNATLKRCRETFLAVEAINITYSKGVFVALVTQHERRKYYIILIFMVPCIMI